jgi:hypothetical protein
VATKAAGDALGLPRSATCQCRTICAVAATAAIALVALVGAGPALAANHVVVTDLVGDTPGGLDISSVDITSKDDGRVIFRTTIIGSARLPSEMEIWINSDRNAKTGGFTTSAPPFAGTDLILDAFFGGQSAPLLNVCKFVSQAGGSRKTCVNLSKNLKVATVARGIILTATVRQTGWSRIALFVRATDRVSRGDVAPNHGAYVFATKTGRRR